MSREDREKLTDRIAKTDYVFRRKVDSFEEAYPTIAKLHVEVTESQIGHGSSQCTRTFTERDFQHAVNCSNPPCYGGGVEIGWIIHDMVRDKKTDHEELKRCQGYEGSPKGRRRIRNCFHSFRIKAHIEYKDNTTEDEQQTTQPVAGCRRQGAPQPGPCLTKKK